MLIPSILTSVKKALGLDESYEAFDVDITMHINSAFSTLNQLGIGPEFGFTIEDKTAVWTEFIGTDHRYNAVKSYVTLRVRLLFDPPTTSFLIEAFNQQIKELEWRLNNYREETAWTDPDPDPMKDPVLDGGAP